jgi:NhaA family Na+:H+ antiporter
VSSKIRVLRPLQDFLRAEAGAGVLLLAMVPIALLWVNGPWSEGYESLWSTEVSIGWGSWLLSMDLHHWVNDGLMAIFFFVVGLEIKREILDGELQDRRKVLTPALAALGGMALPALIYAGVNIGGDGLSGWGIPMATDIAIVLGFLSLLGDRVPTSLKTFLLTLAIVDDIGAILVIALFYSGDGMDPFWLVAAVAAALAYFLSFRLQGTPRVALVSIALVAWYATLESGVHATLIGVALALLTPGRPYRDADYIDANSIADVSSFAAASETVDVAKQTVSSVEWLQHQFHPWSSYFVLPVFALSNAGIVLTSDSISGALTSTAALGVVLGLLIGKPLGICLFTFFAVRFFGGQMPTGVQAGHIAAGSVLAAIGFTVSLFIADLAFTDAALVEEAKAGVLAASFIAGGVGYVGLRLYLSRVKLDTKVHDAGHF